MSFDILAEDAIIDLKTLQVTCILRRRHTDCWFNSEECKVRPASSGPTTTAFEDHVMLLMTRFHPIMNSHGALSSLSEVKSDGEEEIQKEGKGAATSKIAIASERTTTSQL